MTRSSLSHAGQNTPREKGQSPLTRQRTNHPTPSPTGLAPAKASPPQASTSTCWYLICTLGVIAPLTNTRLMKIPLAEDGRAFSIVSMNA